MRVPASYVLPLLDLVAHWRVSEQALLDKLGLTRAALERREMWITSTDFANLVTRAHELTNEPGLALFMGRQLRISSQASSASRR